MKFHETITYYDSHKGQIPGRSIPGRSRLSPANFYAVAIPAHEANGRATTVPILENELLWIKNLRPYYKVYPAILDSLCRLKLDVKYECPDIPQGQLSIRFAVGHEPGTKSGFKISSLFLANGIGRRASKEFKMMIVAANVLNQDGKPDFVRFMIDTIPDNVKSIEESLEIGDPNNNTPSTNKGVQALATRIALTVCMLEHDPDIITPEILSKDEQRYRDESDEWKRKAEERARKRGKVGWSIGKKFQEKANSPHYTNPHFAIRHTGPGGKIPKIVPVKGYWTGKDKLTKVPTGHMLPDGTEIEDGKRIAS